jgi:hypothetical protein
MKNLKIISKSFSSKLTQPNILNDSAPFEELHHYTKGLLKNFKSSLPSIEEIEAELGDM